MRSKTSYFNPALFRKNLARFWPLWGGASLVGALFPLAFLTVLIQKSSFLHRMREPLEVTVGYYSVVAYIIPALSLLYAVLCALAAWGWLYNPRSVGMMHALPVTRKGLFVTGTLSGLAMMLIPYAVTGALTVAVTAGVGGLEPVGLAVTVLCVLGESFFFYASATLIVFVTGNPFAFTAFYFIFHFLAAGAEWLVTRLMTMFYFGVERAYTGTVEFLSPVMYLTRKLDVDALFEQITTPEGWVEHGDLASVTLVNGHLIAVYALVGAVLLALAWELYRRRRSESAGNVVAVGWMKPVFRYGFALCAAFAGGTLLYSVFFEGFQTSETAGAASMAVCMVFAGVLGYYAASMLLAKSLRVFRGSWKGALATALAAAALCFTVAADPAGLESWLPQEEEAAGVHLYMNSWNGSSIFTTLEDPAAIRQVLDAHQAVLQERDTLDRARFVGDYENWYTYFDVTYYLDPDHQTYISRSYRIPWPREAAERSGALETLAALACSPEIQEADIFSNIYNDTVESRLTGGYGTFLYDAGTGAREGLNLTLEQARTLEEAVLRDIRAGRAGRTLFLNPGDYADTVFAGTLEFYYSTVSLNGNWTGQRSETVSLSLSTYCTETLKALEELGVLTAERRMLTYAEEQALNALNSGGGPDTYYRYDDGYSAPVYPEDAELYDPESF